MTFGAGEILRADRLLLVEAEDEVSGIIASEAAASRGAKKRTETFRPMDVAPFSGDETPRQPKNTSCVVSVHGHVRARSEANPGTGRRLRDTSV